MKSIDYDSIDFGQWSCHVNSHFSQFQDHKRCIICERSFQSASNPGGEVKHCVQDFVNCVDCRREFDRQWKKRDAGKLLASDKKERVRLVSDVRSEIDAALFAARGAGIVPQRILVSGSDNTALCCESFKKYDIIGSTVLYRGVQLSVDFDLEDGAEPVVLGYRKEILPMREVVAMEASTELFRA